MLHRRPAAESQKLISQARPIFGPFHDCPEFVGVRLRQRVHHLQQRRVQQNRLQHIVELMGHPSGQGSQALQALRVLKLRPQFARFAHINHVADDRWRPFKVRNLLRPHLHPAHGPALSRYLHLKGARRRLAAAILPAPVKHLLMRLGRDLFERVDPHEFTGGVAQLAVQGGVGEHQPVVLDDKGPHQLALNEQPVLAVKAPQLRLRALAGANVASEGEMVLLAAVLHEVDGDFNRVRLAVGAHMRRLKGDSALLAHFTPQLRPPLWCEQPVDFPHVHPFKLFSGIPQGAAGRLVGV